MKSSFLPRLVYTLAVSLLLGVSYAHNTPPPAPEPDPITTQEQGQLQGQLQGQESTNIVDTVVAPTVISENQINSTIVDESSTVLANSQQQSASSDQSQGQSADSSAAQSQNASNNGVTTTVSSVYKQVRQVASAHADAGNATIPCAKDLRAGIQLPGIGFSVGGSVTKRDCNLLRASEDELARGNLTASIQLRCATKLYRDVFDPKDCLALLDTQTVSKDTASKEYVDRAVKRALSK